MNAPTRAAEMLQSMRPIAVLAAQAHAARLRFDDTLRPAEIDEAAFGAAEKDWLEARDKVREAVRAELGVNPDMLAEVLS